MIKKLSIISLFLLIFANKTMAYEFTFTFKKYSITNSESLPGGSGASFYANTSLKFADGAIFNVSAECVPNSNDETNQTGDLYLFISQTRFSTPASRWIKAGQDEYDFFNYADLANESQNAPIDDILRQDFVRFASSSIDTSQNGLPETLGLDALYEKYTKKFHQLEKSKRWTVDLIEELDQNGYPVVILNDSRFNEVDE